MQVDAVLVLVTDGHRHVETNHAYRREPAYAEARAHARTVIRAGERVAGIDEGGHAPIPREVMLDFGTPHEESFAADHAAIDIAWPDALEVVAAHGAIAAGEEAKLRRQCAEVACPYLARAAA